MLRLRTEHAAEFGKVQKCNYAYGMAHVNNNPTIPGHTENNYNAAIKSALAPSE